MAGSGRARISPEWWREHRPILLATILPVLAAIGVFVAVTTMHTSPNLANRPSMALFSACLDANNLDPIGGYTTQFDATEAAQQAARQRAQRKPGSGGGRVQLVHEEPRRRSPQRRILWTALRRRRQLPERVSDLPQPPRRQCARSGRGRELDDYDDAGSADRVMQVTRSP
jgi:hypothetical protein